MKINTGPVIKLNPNEQNSFIFLTQSGFVDKLLIKSDMLLALIPNIDVITSGGF
jgi:hypothetical protein